MRGAAGGHKAASGSRLNWLSARPNVGTYYLHESLAGGVGCPAGQRAELGNTALSDDRSEEHYERNQSMNDDARLSDMQPARVLLAGVDTIYPSCDFSSAPRCGNASLLKSKSRR